MGKHVVGKWGRDEVTESHQKKKPKQKGMAFYKGDASAMCFLCGEQHVFTRPCDRLWVYAYDRGLIEELLDE